MMMSTVRHFEVCLKVASKDQLAAELCLQSLMRRLRPAHALRVIYLFACEVADVLQVSTFLCTQKYYVSLVGHPQIDVEALERHTDLDNSANPHVSMNISVHYDSRFFGRCDHPNDAPSAR